MRHQCRCLSRAVLIVRSGTGARTRRRATASGTRSRQCGPTIFPRSLCRRGRTRTPVSACRAPTRRTGATTRFPRTAPRMKCSANTRSCETRWCAAAPANRTAPRTSHQHWIRLQKRRPKRTPCIPDDTVHWTGAPPRVRSRPMRRATCCCNSTARSCTPHKTGLIYFFYIQNERNSGK